MIVPMYEQTNERR